MPQRREQALPREQQSVYRCACGQTFMSRAVYERHREKCEAAKKAEEEKKREVKERREGFITRQHIVDPTWTGARVRMLLLNGMEVEGTLQEVARYEVQVDGKVYFKHSILRIEKLG